MGEFPLSIYLGVEFLDQRVISFFNSKISIWFSLTYYSSLVKCSFLQRVIYKNFQVTVCYLQQPSHLWVCFYCLFFSWSSFWGRLCNFFLSAMYCVSNCSNSEQYFLYLRRLNLPSGKQIIEVMDYLNPIRDWANSRLDCTFCTADLWFHLLPRLWSFGVPDWAPRLLTSPVSYDQSWTQIFIFSVPWAKKYALSFVFLPSILKIF